MVKNKSTPEEYEKYRRSIDTSIENLDHLISQTLVLSRYSRTMNINQFSESKLAEIIANEVEQLSLEHANLTLNFNVDEKLKEHIFFVDCRALLRALNNLMTNASRYANSTIKVSLLSEDNNALLIVEDDGPGINPEHREKIFQPFIQLENIQRDISHGHGLGLAIVEQVALWHKGNVVVTKSGIGGAKFELRWPLQFG